MKTISKKSQKKFAMQMGIYPTGKPKSVPFVRKHPPDGPNAVQMSKIRESRQCEEGTLEDIQNEVKNCKCCLLEEQCELIELIVDFDRIQREGNRNNEQEGGGCEGKIAEFLEQRTAIHDKYFACLEVNYELECKERIVAGKKEDFEKLLAETTRGSKATETILEFVHLGIEIDEMKVSQSKAKRIIEMLQEMNVLVHTSICNIIGEMRLFLKNNGRKHVEFLPGFSNLQKMAAQKDPEIVNFPICRVGRYERKGKKTSG